jgi:hypothetical protein
MTPQEAQMLQDLVRKVESTQLTEKDPDAEALLNDGLARDPDSLYKLAQTVLIQNIALDQARAQMQRMQQQLAPPPPPARATSFLGGLLHPGQQQYAPPPPQYQAAPPTYPPPPGYAYPPPSASGGGFLRSAATTAAGVAGGMLAFEGVESLLHHGMGGGYGEFGAMPQETIINNYYDDPSQQGGGDPNSIPGPDEQPQGPYDNASDDAQGYLDDSGAGDDGSSAADFAADAGGDDADDSGGFDQV